MILPVEEQALTNYEKGEGMTKYKMKSKEEQTMTKCKMEG